MEFSTAIIILAAGNSSRLQQPKQLLKFNGLTLLQNTILQAKSVSGSFVIVVTGAYQQEIESDLLNLDVNYINNPDWETGMASSINCGLRTLQNSLPKIKNCIFTVCDQPFLTTKLFQDLIEEQSKSGKGIVASAYDGTLGTPVLFRNNYFEKLKNLGGNEGAKKLIQLYKDDVATVSFEKGAIDIDTIEEYTKLINQQKN